MVTELSKCGVPADQHHRISKCCHWKMPEAGEIPCCILFHSCSAAAMRSSLVITAFEFALFDAHSEA